MLRFVCLLTTSVEALRGGEISMETDGEISMETDAYGDSMAAATQEGLKLSPMRQLLALQQRLQKIEDKFSGVDSSALETKVGIFAPGCNFEASTNDVEGARNDLPNGIAKEPHANACSAKCDATAGCDYFVYAESNASYAPGYCFLKKNSFTKIAKGGDTLGRKNACGSNGFSALTMGCEAKRSTHCAGCPNGNGANADDRRKDGEWCVVFDNGNCLTNGKCNNVDAGADGRTWYQDECTHNCATGFYCKNENNSDKGKCRSQAEFR